jgi:hypothetical protein
MDDFHAVAIRVLTEPQYFFEFFFEFGGLCGWGWSGATVHDFGGVHEEAHYFSKHRQHGRALWGFLTQPSHFAAGFGAIFQEFPICGSSYGFAGTIGSGSGDEFGGHGFA